MSPIRICSTALVAALLSLMPIAVIASEPVLLRTALLVKDASASARFYELLGFRIETEMDNPRKPEGNFFPLNVPATRTRLVIMASASGAGGRLGLVEFSGPTPADNRRDSTRSGLGDAVLVFDVADAEAIHSRLLAANTNIIEPPQVYLSKKLAADGSPMRGHVFHVRDPDGYLIELLQAPKPFAPPLSDTTARPGR